jgi:hypothetical protein
VLFEIVGDLDYLLFFEEGFGDLLFLDTGFGDLLLTE